MTPTTTRKKIPQSKNKVPTKLQIGPYRFEVKLVDKPTTEESILKDQTLSGCAKFDEQVIYLSNKQKRDMLADTLLHEVMHVIFAVSGGWAWEDTDEERIVSMLTTTLLDTMRRNPSLVEYLVNNDAD